MVEEQTHTFPNIDTDEKHTHIYGVFTNIRRRITQTQITHIPTKKWTKERNFKSQVPINTCMHAHDRSHMFAHAVHTQTTTEDEEEKSRRGEHTNRQQGRMASRTSERMNTQKKKGEGGGIHGHRERQIADQVRSVSEDQFG